MKRFVLLLVLSVLSFPAFAVERDSAYDHVMKTGVLRCGYGLWAPHLMKDPNTGKMSGIFYDYVEALGKAMDLKIEWTEEVPFGTHIEALRAGRFDAWCFDWPDAARGKFVDYTHPVYYVAIYAYAREGDARFDGRPEVIGRPETTVATIDGERSSLIAAARFPQAKALALPRLSEPSLMLTNVAEGKADITFTDSYTARQFMKDNPGKLREVELGAPLQVIPNTLAVQKNEEALREMLNSATDQLLNDGVMDGIIAKYETFPGAFLRISRPYEAKR